MKKKFLIVGLALLALVIASLTAIQSGSEAETPENKSSEITPTVVMPIKSSRPGCEEKDRCYIPSQVSIKSGESVTWLNEDAAFHSVTSGTNENPTGLFDSGYLDPNEPFTIKFDESGTFDYFCTLHPWMKGKVAVE